MKLVHVLLTRSKLACKNIIPVISGNPHTEVNMRKMSTTKDNQRIVWVDLEMTGLDIDKDVILEMACLITDAELNIVAEGPQIVINHSEEILTNMNEWSQKHHGDSGLTESCRDSKVTLQEAEYKMLSFVRQFTPSKQCPLGGNSVHADKRFLDKYMPQFMSHLHYRIIDTSTVKELCRRWYPNVIPPRKMLSHRALDDIRESIEELQFYRRTIFKDQKDIFQ